MNIYSLDSSTPSGDPRVKLLSKNARITIDTAAPLAASTSRAGSPSASTSGDSPKTLSTDAPAKPATSSRTHAMFGDEEVNPFFRRLAFSTDGSLLVTPAGICESGTSEKKGKRAALTTVDANIVADGKPKSANGKESAYKQKKLPSGQSPTVYLFARGNLQNESPAAHLPGHKTSSIVVKFNPVLWNLRDKKSAKGKERAVDVDGDTTMDVEQANGKDAASNLASTVEAGLGVFSLKNRSIYAVATHETILIYDTQQATPICMFGSLHFAAFTDLAWYAASLTTPQTADSPI